MDYLYERRRRRRRRRIYRSPLSYDRTSSRDDDDDIEQEIIDRAMEIERNREKNLRRQLEFIVHNVKELERRRHQRYRNRSPEYYERTINSSRHRSFARHSYRNSSSDRLSPTNESSHSETRNHLSRKTKKKSFSYQITMIYRGNGNERYGNEIMVLQENIIVFKGFLRPEEKFTFKFKRSSHRLIVKLDFFINELFECCLTIDCQQKQIQEENQYFQLENIQIPDNIEFYSPNENENLHDFKSSTTINGDNKTTSDNDQQHQKINQVLKHRKETSYVKQRSQRSPPTPSSIKQNGKSKSNSSQVNSTISRQSSSKATSTINKKLDSQPSMSSDNENNLKKEKLSTKPNYGPPQVSTFVRSSSESSLDEKSIVTKQNNEKSSTEIVEPSESLSTKKKDNEEEREEEEEENTDTGNFIGFIQLLQAISGGSIRSRTTNEEGDGIQNLLTRLGIVTQTNTRKKSLNLIPHQKGNVENFLLVYLDSILPDDSLTNKFRHLVNYIKLFDDADDCIAFINSISNEKVLFIVSDALGDPVVSRIQDLQQLFAIYVLCQTSEQADNWSTNQPKIHGINTNINEILQQIKSDIENAEENLLTLTYTLINENSKDESLFIMNQIIKEILLDTDEMIDAKKELIDFCRNEYENNLEQLKFIQQFEDNYQKEENILEFYQKNFFLYKMLNKAFRVSDVDILFKLRLFIQNLHHYIISSSNNLSIKTIYRLQYLTNDELDALKKSTNESLISFSNFFLASIHRPELKSSLEKFNQEGEEILFQINLTNHHHSMLINNDQILVTFGLITRIENIEKDKNGQTIINLITINHDDRQIERLIEPIRKETRAPYPSLRLVKLFIELEQYSYAIYLGQILISDLIHTKKDLLLGLARTYHSLGTALYEKEEYDQALDVIKKSHELYLRFLPEDAPQLSPTWNNMGSIYLRQGNTELALEYHEKALAIQLKSPSPDLPSIISYSNNIGGVYLKLERYDEALIHFKRALQIEEQTLPSNHPELAGTYHRIGGVYFRQNNYEKALEYYDKTLKIELISLPDNHPTVAVTYHNRGTAFEGLGKLEQAIESAEKAVERLLKTLPKDHPQVQMNQSYVDKLKEKLWVKQLFAS